MAKRTTAPAAHHEPLPRVEMEYNTEQPHLLISEYGRNIQKMINYACTLKDREERNKAAQAIIQVMGQLNPHLRDITDFKHKLWDHLFIISDFKLDVDSPFPIPSRETFDTKPDKVNYPHHDIAYKHYGLTVEHLIAKAVEMKDGEMKNFLVELLANLMKRHYLNWNRDSVNDEVIVGHLKELSGGRLKLKDDFVLRHTSEFVQRNVNTGSNERSGGGKKHKHQNNPKHRNNNNRNNNFRNNNRNK
jgi:hypothetical protein